MKSSVNSCIRFRSSEEEVLRRAEIRRTLIHEFVGIPCTKCGSYNHVIPHLHDRTAECEACFIVREYRERTGIDLDTMDIPSDLKPRS